MVLGCSYILDILNILNSWIERIFYHIHKHSYIWMNEWMNEWMNTTLSLYYEWLFQCGSGLFR